MTEQELTQAREDLQQLDIEQLRSGVMLQLLNIEALTAERDEMRRKWLLGHELVTQFAQSSIAITAERDALRIELIEESQRLVSFILSDHAKVCAERDALMSAGKIALEALVVLAEWEDVDDPQRPATEAFAALKKAGVQ